MWVKDLVKFILLIQFLLMSTTKSTTVLNLMDDENETESAELPNIWEDEAVSRMVREVIARDLFREHDFKRQKRQYKRDVHSTETANLATAKSNNGGSNFQTTRRVTSSPVTQKLKKPVKVTQTGNKTKNRVTSASITTTRATVKPNMKPIVSNSNLGNVNASSKIKVSTHNNNNKKQL